MLARELSYYPESSYEVKKEPKRTTRKVHRKGNDNILKYIALIIPIIILSISLLILSRYANITTIRHEITQMEREKIELEKIKMNLAADLEGIKSSARIEEDAINKLGMNYPTEDQIVYITVGENIIETTETAERANLSNKFKSIFSIFSKIL